MTEYIDASDVSAVAIEYGLTWPGSADGTEQTQAIARARLFLDAINWEGRKTDGRDQERQWPRVGVYDRDGYWVDSNAVPSEIKDANALLAIVEAANPGTLHPQVTTGQLVKSVTAGEVQVEFRDTGGVSSARPVITRALDMLEPLMARQNPFALERG
jgi:hypothetical protein